MKAIEYDQPITPSTTNTADPFGPYTTDVQDVRLVEVEVPPGWRVRVIEGSEFQVRLSAIEAESDDGGDSINVSPGQSRGP